MKRILSLAAIALLAAACASTPASISAVAPNQVVSLKETPTLQTDLTSAAYNLNQAVSIGVLPATDPAVTCVNDLLTKTGLAPNTTPPASFVPKNDGLASAGAIAYIIYQQQKTLSGGLKVDPSCEALVGRIVIDGAKAINAPAAALISLPK